MMTTRISVSLDPDLIQFMDGYVNRHARRSRSHVAAEALRLMRQREQYQLEAAYARSASADRALNAIWSGSDRDGLLAESW